MVKPGVVGAVAFAVLSQGGVVRSDVPAVADFVATECAGEGFGILEGPAVSFCLGYLKSSQSTAPGALPKVDAARVRFTIGEVALVARLTAVIRNREEDFAGQKIPVDIWTFHFESGRELGCVSVAAADETSLIGTIGCGDGPSFSLNATMDPQ